MIIEIPDRFLEYVRGMPAQEVEGTKHMKDLHPLRWIGKNKHGCVAMVMVYRAILKRGMELGYIKFNPESQTWQGADYDGD